MGGVLAIPRGATVHGVITESKNVGSGDLAGSSVLALRLTSLDLGGRNYPLDTDQFKVKGPNKAGQTVGSGWRRRNRHNHWLCRGPRRRMRHRRRRRSCRRNGCFGGFARTGVWIPAEALVTFHLRSPLTVDPVSPQEAARLAQGLYPGGPTLYRRAYYPYGAPYYAYPPVLLPAILLWLAGTTTGGKSGTGSRFRGTDAGVLESRMPVVRCGAATRSRAWPIIARIQRSTIMAESHRARIAHPRPLPGLHSLRVARARA